MVASWTVHPLISSLAVSNIEAVQQTLNLTLDSAYTHAVVSVESLIWIRSIAIVLLIVAHALRHVQAEQPQEQQREQPLPELTPELLHELEVLLRQTSVVEEQSETLPQIMETATSRDNQEAPVVAV